MLSRHYPIDSKAKFVRLYKQGEFGNAAPTWNTLDDYLDSGYDKSVHVRNKTVGGKTFYNLKGRVDVIKACHFLGESNCYISAMAPHNKGLIQGEIQETFKGLLLYGVSATLPMREAFDKLCSFTKIGLSAKLYLQKYMDTASYEWLYHLLDMYPNHVIEFSTFSTNWGTVPDRNTVWWEIRLY